MNGVSEQKIVPGRTSRKEGSRFRLDDSMVVNIDSEESEGSVSPFQQTSNTKSSWSKPGGDGHTSPGDIRVADGRRNILREVSHRRTRSPSPLPDTPFILQKDRPGQVVFVSFLAFC